MTENSEINRLACQIKKNNKGGFTYFFIVEKKDEKLFLTDLDVRNAQYPEGYYFDTEEGITNKGSKGLQYEHYRVCKLELVR